MIETLVVYIGLMFLMTYFSNKSAKLECALPRKKSQERIYFFIPILLFAIIFGFRYGVGIDYFAYRDVYLNADYQMLRFEPAFLWITVFCHRLNFDYPIYFTLLSFLQIFFVFLAFRNHKKVLPFLCIVLIASGLALSGWTNGIRQWLSICLFVFALSLYNPNKKITILLTLLITALCPLFHLSAIICFVIPFFFITKNDYFTSTGIQYILLIIFIVLHFVGSSFLTPFIENVTSKLGVYEQFVGGANFEGANKLGIFDFFQYVVYFIIVKFNKEVKRNFSGNPSFGIIYTMGFAGILLHLLFSSSMMLLRGVMVFDFYYYILLAFYLEYFYSCRQTRVKKAYIYMVFFMFISFVRPMIYMKKNTTQYIFYFQEDMHGVKEQQRDALVGNVN